MGVSLMSTVVYDANEAGAGGPEGRAARLSMLMESGRRGAHARLEASRGRGTAFHQGHISTIAGTVHPIDTAVSGTKRGEGTAGGASAGSKRALCVFHMHSTSVGTTPAREGPWDRTRDLKATWRHGHHTVALHTSQYPPRPVHRRRARQCEDEAMTRCPRGGWGVRPNWGATPRLSDYVGVYPRDMAHRLLRSTNRAVRRLRASRRGDGSL